MFGGAGETVKQLIRLKELQLQSAEFHRRTFKHENLLLKQIFL